jgi:hypothetical protein
MADEPMRNIVEFSGIDAVRLEEMEERLKTDVLTEAERNQGILALNCPGGSSRKGKILVHDESAAGALVKHWQEVKR